MSDVIKFNDIRNKNYRLMAEGHILEARYFYFETHPTYNNELAIVFGGHEKCANDFEIRRRTYPYYVLEYCLEGRCTLEINSTAHTLSSGAIAGFTPGNPHHYACNKIIGWEHFWLAFVGTKARELFEKSTLHSKGAVAGSPHTIQLIQAIIANGIQKKQYSQEICSSYLRILLLSLAESRNAEQPATSVAAATYHNCRKYIDENFSSLVSPSQVADACGINVRYMSRLFKKYNTVTSQEYIMRLKLNKAVNLLLTSGLAINEVGHALGFNDPYHFSRVFKRFHGLAPHHYRQMHMM